MSEPTPPQGLPGHISITAVGSRITCNPPPVGTDQDWLVLIETSLDDFGSRLHGDWLYGGSGQDDDDFASFKRGEDNIIVTDNPEFHERFLAAHSVAKRLNLLSKADRVALFRACLYAEQTDQDCLVVDMEGMSL